MNLSGRFSRGFTLIELLVVVALVAIASAGVAFTLGDSSQTQLDREAERLTALLESARAQSRASGVPVRWRATPGGFVFDGLPARTLPENWLQAGTTAVGPAVLRLGPEPLIGRQEVALAVQGNPTRVVRVATDGLRPFAVQPVGAP